MQLFIKLRGAIFAESGFCLNPPPGALRKDATAYFVSRNVQDGGRLIERVPGCAGGDDTNIVSIDLQPYPSEKARDAVAIMCKHLKSALAGDRHAKEGVWLGWTYLVAEGLVLKSQTPKTQLAVVMNLFGLGRVNEQLNKHGTLAGFVMPEPLAMVDEALGLT